MTRRNGMGLLNILRYVFAAMRSSRATIALLIAAVAVGGIYTYVLGYYGVRVYGHQQATLGESGLTRIVATPRDVTDTRRWWDDPAKAAVRGFPAVTAVEDLIELNVRLFANGGEGILVPAESTFPGDPALASGVLEWGSGVTAHDAHEIVLSRSLFDRLDGRFSSQGGLPEAVTLTVERKADGRPEVQRILLRVRGFLKPQRSDRAYVPLTVMKLLDGWCTSRLRELRFNPGDSPKDRLSYPLAYAYGPSSQRHRAAAEFQDMGLEGTAVDEFEMPVEDGPVWVNVPLGADSAALARAERFDSRTVTLDGLRVTALPEGDPRWNLCGGPVEGKVYEVRTAPAGFPLDADLFCTPGTLRRRTFDPRRSDAVKTFSRVVTTDLETALRIEEVWGVGVEADSPIAWVIVCPSPVQAFPFGLNDPDPYEILLDDLRPLIPKGGAGITKDVGEADIDFRVRTKARQVPHSFLEWILGKKVQTDSLTNTPAVVTGTTPPRQSSTLTLGILTLNVLSRLDVPSAEVWVSDGNKWIIPRRNGILVWGPWADVGRCVRQVRDSHPKWTLVNVLSSLPKAFSALIPVDNRQIDTMMHPEPGTLKITEVMGMPHGSNAVVLGFNDLSKVSKSAWSVKDDTAIAGEGTLLGRGSHMLTLGSTVLSLLRDQSVPNGIVIVPERVFTELAYENASRTGPIGIPRTDVRFKDFNSLSMAKAKLTAGGGRIQPMGGFRTQELVRYRVRDPGNAEGITPSLVCDLRLRQPSFIGAVPHVELEAVSRDAKSTLRCVATHPLDPWRYRAGLVQGRWIVKEDSFQVVAPESWMGGLAQPRTLHLEFRRPGHGGSSEILRLSLEVVGHCVGKEVYLPVTLAGNLLRWTQDRVDFDLEAQTFGRKADIVAASGSMRAAVYAADVGSVAPVVRHLEQLGYRTEHHLADLDALATLGRVLVFMVAFFVLGCVLNAAISVLVATLMNVKSKIWEVGILRSFGARTSDIFGIFLAQAVIVGSLAFLVSAGAVALLEPQLRRLIQSAFSSKVAGVFEGSPFSVNLWWLSAAVFAIAVGFSLLGVIGPAGFASRLSPVEAFRRRD